ncbi:MAG TPA: DNA polymerase Y family protein [Opitutus sp.]|nr:DNA polymerase Y family protein [Opitutus sp.]
MFAVLHIADFALHAVLRLESAAASTPAALFAATSKRSIVLATNPAARTAGVELGMTAPQAVARCPALLIRTPQPAAETDARAALLTAGFTLSPALEATAPGICTAEVGGLEAGKRERLARHALAELMQLGLPATAGLGATPLLALYAARAATDTSPVRCVADEKSFLATLPLAAADPSPELAGVFQAWGIRTFGELTALPRDEIVRRFGAAGLALWQRASGGSPRPLHPVTPPATFAAAMEFEHEIETLEPLLFVLRRFLDRLTLELRVSQHVAAELHLVLRLEDETAHARSFRLPEPTSDVEILFRTLHTHLESVQTPSSVRALELRLTPARPLVRQQGLFDTGLRDPHGFAETLARIGALVGPDRLGTPELEDTHRPDAVKMIPPLPIVPPPAEPPIHPPLGAPLRRFRPPLPARVEFTHSRPTYLWTDHVSGEITFQSSACPSSGEWWQRDRAWSRTEWDIALATGGVYRLLLIRNSYFLEGEYD